MFLKMMLDTIAAHHRYHVMKKTLIFVQQVAMLCRQTSTASCSYTLYGAIPLSK